MELLGAVALGDTGPHGGVGVHALTGGRARQELGEDLHVLEAGHQLLDAHEGDERVRQGQAHAPVALGLVDRDRAGLGHTHVRAGDGHRGVQELVAQVRAGRGRELLGVVGEVLRGVLHAVQEDAAHLGAVAVDRGHHDVRGHVVGQLDDHLGQVRLVGGDAPVGQVLVEVRLLGGHRLDLDDVVDALGGDDVGDDPVGLGGVTRPVDDAAAGGHVGLELLQQLGQARGHLELDGLGGVAQVLPVGHLGYAVGALGADGARGVAQVAAHLGVGQRLVRALGEGVSPAQRVLGLLDLGAPPARVGHTEKYLCHRATACVC